MLTEPRRRASEDWLKVASLILTLMMGAAVLYSRLCVLEAKIEIVAERVARLEHELRTRNLLAPTKCADVGVR